jgi:tRNA (uracil-5-)-methyltransferase
MTNPLEHIHGKTHITDKILGYTFQISPDSFFQVNTKGAEILYQTAIDLGQPTEKTTLLDVCCGTGTIGLCFAKYCKKVLGVELIEQAVKDAESNAKANGIENAEFFAGNSDDFIGTLMRKATADGGESDVLAILDPPRAGLRK